MSLHAYPVSREAIYPIVPWDEDILTDRALEFLGLLGLDRLEVWIQSQARGNVEQAKLLRDRVADVVQVTGVEGLEEIRVHLEEAAHRKAKILGNQEYGRMIQNFVKEILEAYNLDVEVVDRGYDFEVYERGEADAETDGGRLEIGPYLVEVKSSRTQEVRMTPLQAETAVKRDNLYVLCVVDLRNSQTEHPEADDVREAARFVTQIGKRLRPLVEGVDEAVAGGSGVRLDQTGQLRYAVDQSLWGNGETLFAWVARAFPTSN